MTVIDPSDPNPTYVTRLTPRIPSAIATLSIRGGRAIELMTTNVRFRKSELRIGRVLYGTIRIHAGPSADCYEQVVICQTAQDEVELHCHGGTAVCNAIVQRLKSQGCQWVDASDWPSRCACPISQAAEQDLLQAVTDKTAAVLVDQWNGALAHSLQTIGEQLEAGDGANALERLQELHSHLDLGLHLAKPWKVILAGPPNVGKSSLMNAILGQSRSIVHEEAGTTRDWIESLAAIDGWPVAVTDTAGIRTGIEDIENQGVRLAQQQASQADLLVLVVDGSCGWTDVHGQLAGLPVKRQLIAWNKADLVVPNQSRNAAGVTIVATSTVGPPGIDALLDASSSLLVPCIPRDGSAVPFRKQHGESVEQAILAIRASDLTKAKSVLQDLLVPWTQR